MFEFVRQREADDCGVAAIAMLTGKSYEEVFKEALDCGEYAPPRGMSMPIRTMQRLGYNYEWVNGVLSPDHNVQFPSHLNVIEKKFFTRFFWGRRCVLSVDSINVEGGLHMVYYDGHRVWDPQEGNEGKKFFTQLEEVAANSAVIIRE